ncbi:hypothetical protein PGTUg99_023160 [Puccinia graminis f. sp. tritici]|uniref:Uncharacterized protein n=1 Tax=Puccinia graminis f. sp. tritici TaxID=56615 RepID=A0A5B0S0T8_PUCGR|nr:hypothetical protein PGTUg99_023160 [Puccinia graminis f. sp. tritici]
MLCNALPSTITSAWPSRRSSHHYDRYFVAGFTRSNPERLMYWCLDKHRSFR